MDDASAQVQLMAQLAAIRAETQAAIAELKRGQETWRADPLAAQVADLRAQLAAAQRPPSIDWAGVAKLASAALPLLSQAAAALRGPDLMGLLGESLREARTEGLLREGLDLARDFVPLIAAKAAGLPLRDAMAVMGRELPAPPEERPSGGLRALDLDSLSEAEQRDLLERLVRRLVPEQDLAAAGVGDDASTH